MNTKEQKLKFIKKQALRITPYIFYFFIFSFLGWISETIFCYVTLGKLLERGFLYAPICPIYGYGGLILILYLDNSRSRRNYLKLFTMFIIVFSFFEYLVGFSLEALFSLRWWNYIDSPYNLNGRITILNSFLWGVATVLFVRFVYPLVRKFKIKIIDKIPDKTQLIMSTILVTAMFIDSICSCIKYVNFEGILY